MTSGLVHRLVPRAAIHEVGGRYGVAIEEAVKAEMRGQHGAVGEAWEGGRGGRGGGGGWILVQFGQKVV